MSLIAQRLDVIKPSPTLALSQKAAELKRGGRDIISLTVGEPDFDTPENVKEAAIEAIKSGFTKYTNVDGIPELKMAIQKKFAQENGLDYDLKEIIVSNGGKQVIYNLFMATLNPGDEVIIPAPYWVSYPDMVLLAGGVPITVECSMTDGFKLNNVNIRSHITSKTKWIIINSPSNPTGAVYSLEELEMVAEVMREHPHLYAMVDDIYEHIIFDGQKFYTLAEVAPDLKSRIFIVNGVSKSYSMTGWRIGYGAGPKQIINAMTMVQSQSTSNPSSISQKAALEALSGPQNFIPAQCMAFQQKRNTIVSMLNEIPGMDCLVPGGAFYVFPSCKNFFGKHIRDGDKITNSSEFAEYLLEAADVAVVPGSAFGLEGCVRISYATAMETLVAACHRIRDACERLG